ncbi:MAG: DUF262 domain-containing protein [Bacteroidales bacterium]|nr:DUF262 domain-containing protein [Bacteroidales bacterium]
MATNISVSKLSVLELLSNGKTRPFVIPEYQRPYMWSDEQVETLFEDIWEFAKTTGGTRREGTYFLGSIVSYEENNEQLIIDGQQRITSLFLLLRAIYTKLSTGEDAQTDAAQNFIRLIEPAIWRLDKLTGRVNHSDILLTSRVVDDEKNAILHSILETGQANAKAKDNYSKNYLHFQQLYDKHCMSGSLQVYDFIYALLNQAILLPITADTQDTALTIFQTLNNRGLPLNDADIFKAKIYNHLHDEDKADFINKWKKLEKEAEETGEDVTRLFYYYMFYLRAKDKIVDSTTPALRRYFLEHSGKRLYEDSLMDNLDRILTLWKVVNRKYDIPEEKWDNNPNIQKALDTLRSYPNEYWKYPVVIYYLTHEKNSDFEQSFLVFLNKLCGELAIRFTLTPTVNAVKTDVLRLNVAIIGDAHPTFTEFRPIDTSTLPERIKTPHSNIVRMLLKMYTYHHQQDILKEDWQVEHILPRKWQSTFFTEAETEQVDAMIEHIGNKTPLGRILNIVASNGYFAKKKEQYKESKAEVTRQLTAIDHDWTLQDIKHRDEVITQDLLDLIASWNKEYTEYGQPVPTPEEAAMINRLKERGLI